jgi:hypothetical protein
MGGSDSMMNGGNVSASSGGGPPSTNGSGLSTFSQQVRSGNAANKVTAMQIRCKFGQLGPSKGQFNSPHGFCLGNDEDIVVADTNNHRIQVNTHHNPPIPSKPNQSPSPLYTNQYATSAGCYRLF